MSGWVVGTLEKGKRTRLRVTEGKKQETAIQPGSRRERKQRTANRALQGPEWRGRDKRTQGGDSDSSKEKTQ